MQITSDQLSDLLVLIKEIASEHFESRKGKIVAIVEAIESRTAEKELADSEDLSELKNAINNSKGNRKRKEVSAQEDHRQNRVSPKKVKVKKESL